MRSYRKHLSGEAAFKSFVPTPLSEIQVIHTEELDKLIMETESAMQQFNDDASQLSEEQIKQLMWQEAENSCKLALGEHFLRHRSYGRIAIECPSVEKRPLPDVQ